MNKIKNHSKGFTLLELLVVVLIIGILAGIALPQYKMAVYKSRYKSLMALVNAMYEAEEVYFLNNNSYTADLTALDIDLSGCKISSNKNECTFDWGKCGVELRPVAGYTGDRVYCTRTEGLQNTYNYYFRLNNEPVTLKQRFCSAKGYDTTNIWNQVCQKVGAQQIKLSGVCYDLGGVSCNVYKF